MAVARPARSAARAVRAVRNGDSATRAMICCRPVGGTGNLSNPVARRRFQPGACAFRRSLVLLPRLNLGGEDNEGEAPLYLYPRGRSLLSSSSAGQYFEQKRPRGERIGECSSATASHRMAHTSSRTKPSRAERFAKFGLELHPVKNRLLEFGRYAAEEAEAERTGKPESFDSPASRTSAGRPGRGGSRCCGGRLASDCGGNSGVSRPN